MSSSPQPEGETPSAEPLFDQALYRRPLRRLHAAAHRAAAFSQRPAPISWSASTAPSSSGWSCTASLQPIRHQVSSIHFGATNTFLILHGQWYRLLTAIFVHVGLLHIATNMWCLWNLGLLGEPLLGPWGIIAVYMLTGIAGNLLSMGYNIIRHDYISVGAGASGAVFGIAGILIVLLSNNKLPIPHFERNRLRRSVIQFAMLNLIIGLGTVFLPVIRIDNNAHVGGFLFGLALGVPLVPRMTSGRSRYLERQKITFAGAALFLALFGYFVANLH